MTEFTPWQQIALMLGLLIAMTLAMFLTFLVMRRR